MATMHIKNKFEVSFKELITATKQKGGVPDHIDVTPQEAWDILREIHRFGRKSPFSISGYCGHQTSKQFEVAARLVNKTEPIERAEALNLINSWMRGEYQVHLNGIPIDVKPEQKAPAPTESSISTKPWYKRLFKS